MQGVAPGVATEPVTMRSALPILDDSTRSPNPDVCPFFRRQSGGLLFAPLNSPDEENVCAAIGVPKPQSARQQELVCLKATHADCPRYLRGAMAYPEPPRPRRQAASVPRATVAALLVLVLSAGISFGFVVQRGGIEMPVVAAAPSSSAVAVVASATPSAAPASVAPSVVATAVPTASPSPSPSPTPTPTPSPTAKPTPKPTKKPTSDRYKLLKACPNRDSCWIYTVRSGDNLSSIANYFGHPLKTIYRWNPQYPGTALRVGAQIRMPPPTR